MSYTNENFERFQTELGCRVDSVDLLWNLRDAFFAEAYYGKARNRHPVLKWTGGDMLRLLKDLASSPRPRPGIDLSGVNTCVLLPSARSNHVGRLVPFTRELSGRTVVLITEPDALERIEAAAVNSVAMIGGAWKRTVKVGHYLEASKETRRLMMAMPTEFSAAQLAAIRIYLTQFFAWCDLWRRWLKTGLPHSMISTFEKAPHAKAFFFVGREMGVPERIHWIHGLRHASIQATLATELWCMTPGDERFFRPRVPAFCTPRVVENPERRALAETVGRFEPAAWTGSELRFVFLGPGAEESYTKEMRMADLGVIRSLQRQLGDRISWRFRPHPSMIDRFRDELAEAAIACDDFSTRPLDDDLKWAHAVGSSWSSLLLDVKETGRPIFWVQDEVRTLGSVDELIADGIGTHLDAASGVERLVKVFPTLAR